MIGRGREMYYPSRMRLAFIIFVEKSILNFKIDKKDVNLLTLLKFNFCNKL